MRGRGVVRLEEEEEGSAPAVEPPPKRPGPPLWTRRRNVTVPLIIVALLIVQGQWPKRKDLGLADAARINSANWLVFPNATIPKKLVFVTVWNEANLNGTAPLPSDQAKWAGDVDNVRATIQRLKLPHVVYDDADCLALLREMGWLVLADAFRTEPFGPYKSDMCRSAVLLHEGGIYMDTDMVVVGFEPDMLDDWLADLVTVKEMGGGGIFQSFTAAAPGHPVLRDQMQRMSDAYNASSPGYHKYTGPGLRLGPNSLQHSVDAFEGRAAVYLLVETAFPWWRHYPDWKRDLGAYHLSSGLECTVVDPGEDRTDFEVAQAIGVPLFYSRTVMGGSAERMHPLVMLLLYVLWNAFLYAALSAAATVTVVMAHQLREAHAARVQASSHRGGSGCNQ